ncbi:MAG: UDP-3-O-(3-hydroxymyristoyl)glucosamine N-acyltransferase [Bdellovibrionales bacterium]|nr:UDP-3-O-(3-hydroxymyristoyl)glucosamine N-acyltransferase [Bdellovibrionales bacterium]
MKLGSLKLYDASFEFIKKLDENTIIEGITDTSEYLPRHILFVKNKFFLNEFLESNDAQSIAIVLDKKFSETLTNDQLTGLKEKAWIIGSVQDVNLAMSFLSKPFYDEKIGTPNDIVDGRQMGSTSVHPSAWIGQGVFVGANVVISANVKLHPGVVLMSGVQIGEGTEIFPNTTIYRNVKIGMRVRIHANCSIGADGFGYNFSKGVHHKVWHMGSVVIEDEVEIGSGTCIDSGTFSPTYIGHGSKLDNQVQVGHNCKLGRGVVLCGQVGIGGSTVIGDFTVLGGAAMVANGMKIGSGVQIAGGSGVTGRIEDGEIVGGFPARDIKEWFKGVAYIRKMSLAVSKKE